MSTTTPEASATPRAPSSRGRKVLVAVIVFLGVCQLLTTSEWLDLNWLPQWLGGVIAMTGFLTFLLLAGPFGNAIVSIALPLLAWRRWKWPLWQALLTALPFWIVVYRLMPKPWA